MALALVYVSFSHSNVLGSITTNSSIFTSQPQSVNINSCPNQNIAIVDQAYYLNYANSPAQVTYITSGVGYNVSLSGSSAVQFQGALSGQSTTIPSTGTLSCRTNYQVVDGDLGGTYYTNYTIVNTGTNASVTLGHNGQGILLAKYSAPTLTVSNSSQEVASSSGVVIKGVSAGVPVSNDYIFIQAGTNWFGLPTGLGGAQGGFALEMVYNSTGESITLSGAPSIPTTALPAVSYVTSNTGFPSEASVGAQNAASAWLLPAIHEGQYATVSGGVQTPTSINPLIMPTSAYSQNDIVSVYLIAPNNLLYNGKVETQQFVNQKQQAVFTVTSLKNAFVLQNH